MPVTGRKTSLCPIVFSPTGQGKIFPFKELFSPKLRRKTYCRMGDFSPFPV
jgi:hypothetical protein